MENLNLIWFVLVGILTAFWATALMTPQSRRYGIGGLFALAILGALVGGLILPGVGWFVTPLSLIGLIILSFFGAVVFIWSVSLLLVLLLPTTETEI